MFTEHGPGLPADYNLHGLFDDALLNSTRNWMQVLYGLCRAMSVRRIVEIGVFQGVTTSVLAHALRMNGGGRLTAVDNDAERLMTAMSRVVANGLGDYVEFVLGDSKTVSVVPYDLLFIDGDHSFAGVSGDWNHWAADAPVGSMVCIHDTLDPEIAKFIAGWPRFKGWQMVDFPGDCGMAILRRVG